MTFRFLRFASCRILFAALQTNCHAIKPKKQVKATKENTLVLIFNQLYNNSKGFLFFVTKW